MNKILRCFILVLLATVCTISSADNGVSLKLARFRSATVSNVRYDLKFTVTDSLDKPVCGKAVISFNYTGKEDLPLDFTGVIVKDGRSSVCTVNSKPFGDAAIADEHIIIPRKLLRRGKNIVDISFESSNAALNRHKDYMYTLFVPANARSCFPCFDQPDLKAVFTLDLTCPEGWKSVSSADSHPIPTYLFSFVCGKFQERHTVIDRVIDPRTEGKYSTHVTMSVLYRETDSAKVAQLDKVFEEAAYSRRWLEEYTGIKYPFDKFGFVILPGYQFGGMEHPGAIQFTDNEIFLGPNPTPDEKLTRLELIAHETAHAWFGDMVTMKWFNDVWTKEVFANFLANKFSRWFYPEINHDLNFLKSYQRPALTVDRTDGTHPIQQPLDNLNNAGLLYGNIIYDKAPVMMRKLEQQAGEENFRKGLQAYLEKYRYANATWDDLVNILDSVAPEAHLKEFSNVWVKQKGLPTITYSVSNDTLHVRQTDPYNRGITWQQSFAFGIGYGDSIEYKTVKMDGPEAVVALADNGGQPHIYPNIDGQGYGRFVINNRDIDANLDFIVKGQKKNIVADKNRNETAVYSTLLNLYENYLMGNLAGKRFFSSLSDAINICTNPLIGSTIVSDMGTIRYYAPDSLRHSYERQSLAIARTNGIRSIRQQMLRSLSTSATDELVIDTLYNMWVHQKDTTVLSSGMLTTRDYTRMAYHLAIMLPDKSADILSTQRTMLKTVDEKREFDYVSRACTADTAMQRSLFYSLIPKEGRTVEPWARQMLSLLCDQSREPHCNSYIKPGLDNLLMIQQSSDIFFPGYWLSALLGGQHSAQARSTVEEWINAHKDYPETLMNKLKQSAFSMFCVPKEEAPCSK